MSYRGASLSSAAAAGCGRAAFSSPQALVPLGLAMVLGLQASQDPLAMGRGAPVTVAAVATWR
jgi:hypothetical protein